jgi:hypothetical protein
MSKQEKLDAAREAVSEKLKGQLQTIHDVFFLANGVDGGLRLSEELWIDAIGKINRSRNGEIQLGEVIDGIETLVSAYRGVKVENFSKAIGKTVKKFLNTAKELDPGVWEEKKAFCPAIVSVIVGEAAEAKAGKRSAHESKGDEQETARATVVSYISPDNWRGGKMPSGIGEIQKMVSTPKFDDNELLERMKEVSFRRLGARAGWTWRLKSKKAGASNPLSAKSKAFYEKIEKADTLKDLAEEIREMNKPRSDSDYGMDF